MNIDPKKRRRRNAGAIAAISGGGAASAIGISHHTGTPGPESIVWQDIGIAAAIVLIIVALVACAVAARRSRS